MKKDTKTKEKKKKGGKGKKVFLVILLIILILGGIFAYKVHKNGGGLRGMLATTLGHDENTLKKLPKMYCLLVGKSENLTDTIMLASYDPKTQESALLSIPRDTFVGTDKNTADTYDKINAVYNSYSDPKKGAEKLLEGVRRVTEIDVKYYVIIDTEALKVLVDEIGGVTFNVPIDMKYDDNRQNLHINLKAGVQVLDGDKAEQVVRFRHNNDRTTYPSSYGTEDIGRMRTQREFLTAVAKQTLVPANITKIPNFIDIAKNYVETNLDFDSIKDYVPYAVNFDASKLKTDKLPGTPEYFGRPGNKYSFYSVDKEKATEVINNLFYTQVEETNQDTNTTSDTATSNNGTSSVSDIKRSEVNIEVLNGSGSSTNLSEVVSELKAAGYKVEKTGKTTTTARTTIINRGNVGEMIENDIKKILDVGNITAGQSSGDTNITIILGTDYIL